MLNLAEYRQRPALLADWLPWAGLIALAALIVRRIDVHGATPPTGDGSRAPSTEEARRA